MPAAYAVTGAKAAQHLDVLKPDNCAQQGWPHLAEFGPKDIAFDTELIGKPIVSTHDTFTFLNVFFAFRIGRG